MARVMYQETLFFLTEDVRAFMRALVAGLADLESERDVALAVAKARLGLK